MKHYKKQCTIKEISLQAMSDGRSRITGDSKHTFPAEYDIHETNCQTF